jgi:ribosomal-protein-serine acetyltransferase
MFYQEIGEGLWWRPSTILDAEEMFEIIDRNRVEFGRWLPWVALTTTVADERNFIRESGEKWARLEGMSGVAVLNGKIVASVDPAIIDMSGGWAEIGYWCDSRAQGKGIVTRTVRAIERLCFEDLGLRRVQIRADTQNLRSRAVPERLGYTLEGVLRGAAHEHED